MVGRTVFQLHWKRRWNTRSRPSGFYYVAAVGAQGGSGDGGAEAAADGAGVGGERAIWTQGPNWTSWLAERGNLSPAWLAAAAAAAASSGIPSAIPVAARSRAVDLGDDVAWLRRARLCGLARPAADRSRLNQKRGPRRRSAHSPRAAALQAQSPRRASTVKSARMACRNVARRGARSPREREP